jgi:hypothetical protein
MRWLIVLLIALVSVIGGGSSHARAAKFCLDHGPALYYYDNGTYAYRNSKGVWYGTWTGSARPGGTARVILRGSSTVHIHHFGPNYFEGSFGHRIGHFC